MAPCPISERAPARSGEENLLCSAFGSRGRDQSGCGTVADERGDDARAVSAPQCPLPSRANCCDSRGFDRVQQHGHRALALSLARPARASFACSRAGRRRSACGRRSRSRPHRPRALAARDARRLQARAADALGNEERHGSEKVAIFEAFVEGRAEKVPQQGRRGSGDVHLKDVAFYGGAGAVDSQGLAIGQLRARQKAAPAASAFCHLPARARESRHGRVVEASFFLVFSQGISRFCRGGRLWPAARAGPQHELGRV